MNTVNRHQQKMGFTWEEAEMAAFDRHGWRRNVSADGRDELRSKSSSGIRMVAKI